MDRVRGGWSQASEYFKRVGSRGHGRLGSGPMQDALFGVALSCPFVDLKQSRLDWRSTGGVAERAGKHDSGRSSRHLSSSLLETRRVDGVDACSCV